MKLRKDLLMFVLAISILYISTTIYTVSSATSYVDNMVLQESNRINSIEIILKLISNSSQLKNLTDTLNELVLSKNFNLTSYGYLEISPYGTSPLIRESYIISKLYFDGLDAHYFIGFSEKRFSVILLSINDSQLLNNLNIDEPKDASTIIIIPSLYKKSMVPIFKIIKDASKAELYAYAYTLTLNISKVTYTNNYDLIMDYLGLPKSVIDYSTNKTYILKEAPPIFVYVNWNTYWSICTISEQVIRGNYYTIKIFIPIKGLKNYYDIISIYNDFINTIRNVLLDLGFTRYNLYSPMISHIYSVYKDAMNMSIPMTLLNPIILAITIILLLIIIRKFRFIRIRTSKTIYIYHFIISILIYLILSILILTLLNLWVYYDIILINIIISILTQFTLFGILWKIIR